MVWATLHELNYSLQGNRKMEEGDQHADRNAQFEQINRTTGKTSTNRQTINGA